MASQLVATSGNKRLKRDQIAELEAKMGSLKDIQAQKAQREMHRDTMRFKAKEFQQQKKQSKKTLAFQQTVAEREMGVAAAGLGFNMATSDGGATISQIGSGMKGGLQKLGFMKGGNTFTNAQRQFADRQPISGALSVNSPTGANAGFGSSPAAQGGGGGFFDNLQPGRILGAGLAGFGASRMVKGKGKRMLLGAGVGGLMSLFGGAGGIGTMGGALFGGLAGLI
jgi:hypothetical protein